MTCLIVRPAIKAEVTVPFISCYLDGFLRSHNLKSRFLDLNFDQDVRVLMESKDASDLIFIVIEPARALCNSDLEILENNFKLLSVIFPGKTKYLLSLRSTIAIETKIPDIKVVCSIFFKDWGLSFIKGHESEYCIYDHAPNWSIIEFGRYNKTLFASAIHVSMLTSIGCSFDCSYCLEKKEYFSRCMDDIVRDIRLAQGQGVDNFVFEDDLINNDTKHLMQLCKTFMDNSLLISWQCLNGLYPGNIDKKLIEVMKQSGCFHITLGVEHFDRGVLDEIGRGGYTTSHIRDVIIYCKRNRVIVTLYLIYGLPQSNIIKDLKTFIVSLLVNPDMCHYGVYGVSWKTRSLQIFSYLFFYTLPHNFINIVIMVKNYRNFIKKVFCKFMRDII